MATVRMSLKEAAATLGIKPNSVRSRFKANKIRGERDNSGKLWVYIDPEAEGSTSNPSKPSMEAFEGGTLEALEAHIRTLKADLAEARAELADLRPKAARSDALAIEIEAAKKLIALHEQRATEAGEQRDQYRQEARETLQRLIALTEEANRRKGLFAWLWRNKESNAS